jgi:rfaE bifunctional protein kinase chain/domain
VKIGAGNVAMRAPWEAGRPDRAVGNDVAAERLGHELEMAGIKSDGLIVDGSRPTTIKSRVVAGSQHVVRFDRESDAPVSQAIRGQVIAAVRERLREADVLLISDYAKGLVSPALVRAVLALAARERRLVAVDPKVQHLALFKGVTVVAPNHHEAAAAARIPGRDVADLVRAGQRLLRSLKARAVLITRGEHGMCLFEGAAEDDIPTVAREVRRRPGGTRDGALSRPWRRGRHAQARSSPTDLPRWWATGTATVSRAELDGPRDGKPTVRSSSAVRRYDCS